MPRGCATATYQRRQPEDSVLYRTVQAHLDAFLARATGDPKTAAYSELGRVANSGI